VEIETIYFNMYIYIYISIYAIFSGSVGTP